MTASDMYCAVKVEGQELTDMVVRVTVEESDQRADSARVIFGDSQLVLCDVLYEGLAIEIDIGRAAEHAVVFRGVITSVSSHFPTAGSPTAEVVAEDALILLSMQPRTHRWGNVTVSQVVRRVAVDNRLTPGTIAPGDDALLRDEQPAQQVAETDLAFLERLAQDTDSKLYVDHSATVDSLNFVSNQSLLDADPIEQSLAFNANLVDFRATFDAWAADPTEQLVTTDSQSGDRVMVEERLAQTDDAAWTPDATRISRLGAGGSARVAELIARSAGKRTRVSEFLRPPPRRAGAASRSSGHREQAHGDRLRRRGQTGRGRTIGNIWIRPRARVEIIGYGGRWSGIWNLARVRHELDIPTRNYTTTFACVR